jgi:hypothetical protein
MKKLILIAVLAFSAPAFATARSTSAKTAFVKRQACPATASNKLPCTGYVIDHITSLDCGGADAPENMQWLTVAAGKAKDKWERNGPTCAHRTSGVKQP